MLWQACGPSKLLPPPLPGKYASAAATTITYCVSIGDTRRWWRVDRRGSSTLVIPTRLLPRVNGKAEMTMVTRNYKRPSVYLALYLGVSMAMRTLEKMKEPLEATVISSTTM